MAYFPFFMDLTGADGLIAGGGTVALRKIEKLLPYGPRLTVAAPEISPEIRAIPGLTLLRRTLLEEDLAGRSFVIAATDKRAVNREIAALCRRRGILVNAVDDRKACTFLFPALVRRGELSIGISTGGASPTAAVYFKQQIEGLLPERTEELLDFLDGLRERVKREIPEEWKRSQSFAALFQACMEARRPLTEAETAEVIRRKVEKRQ